MPPWVPGVNPATAIPRLLRGIMRRSPREVAYDFRSLGLQPEGAPLFSLLFLNAPDITPDQQRGEKKSDAAGNGRPSNFVMDSIFRDSPSHYEPDSSQGSVPNPRVLEHQASSCAFDLIIPKDAMPCSAPEVLCFDAPRISGCEIACYEKAESGAPAMAFGMECTGLPGAGVRRMCAKEIKRPMTPDGAKGIGQDVAEQEVLHSEKKVARINRAVRHHAQFRGPCRTPHTCEFRIIRFAREKARAVNQANLPRIEAFFHL